MTLVLSVLHMLVQYLKHILSGTVCSDLIDAAQDLTFSCLFVSDPSQGNQTVKFDPLLDSFKYVKSPKFVPLNLYEP